MGAQRGVRGVERGPGAGGRGGAGKARAGIGPRVWTRSTEDRA